MIHVWVNLVEILTSTFKSIAINGNMYIYQLKNTRYLKFNMLTMVDKYWFNIMLTTDYQQTLGENHGMEI